MPQYVRHNGVWREVKQPYVRHLGAWRSVDEGYVRHAGVWRQFHKSRPTPGDPSSVGMPYEGGFYAGANIIIDGQEYALVVAPRSQGGLSSGRLQWKTADTGTSGTDSRNDGWANSNNMNNTSHPAARFCRRLNINGHTDWYLPSRDESEICYRYLKPNTASNATLGGFHGINPSSNPEGTPYTTGDPSQTSISIFQEGGGEDFRTDSTVSYWTSTHTSSETARRLSLNMGSQFNSSKTISFWVRAVRKVAV